MINRFNLNYIIIVFVITLFLYCLLGSEMCVYAEQLDQVYQNEDSQMDQHQPKSDEEDENAEWSKKMKYAIINDLFWIFAILVIFSAIDVVTGRPL